MAVTVVGKKITMTAASDEVAMPLHIKNIRWVGTSLTAAEDELILVQSSIGDTSKEIWRTIAAGANYVEESLFENPISFGIRVDTIDSGQVDIYLK